MNPAPFPALKLLRAFQQSERTHVNSGARRNAVVLGVISDVVTRQSAYDILAAAAFQHTRLLANYLERRSNSHRLQIVRDP
jgi:hypothetical protein